MKYRPATLDGDKQATKFQDKTAIQRDTNERMFDTFSIENDESDPEESTNALFSMRKQASASSAGPFSIDLAEGSQEKSSDAMDTACCSLMRAFD